MAIQEENSPIILLSTSEAAREIFIQQLMAALFEKNVCRTACQLYVWGGIELVATCCKRR